MAGLLQYVGLCVVLSLRIMQVFGLNFTVSRDKVLNGSTGTLQLNCGITESDVDSVFLIQILRETTPRSGITEVLAEMKASATTPTIKVTGEDKRFVAGGTWYGANTSLTLDMDMTKIQCNDARAYSCDLTYLSTGGQSVKVQQKSTFSVFVYPSIMSLQGTRNGMLAQNASTIDTGDILKLTCRANIGSFSQTKIEWEKTSETSGSVDEFKGYTPPPLTFTDGDPLSDHQCGYTREATITYNVKSADANKENNLAFRCYVTVSGDPYGTYTTRNNPSFYVNVRDKVDITPCVVGGVVSVVVIIAVVSVILFAKKKNLKRKNQKEPESQLDMGQSRQDPEATYVHIHETAVMENRRVYDSIRDYTEWSSVSSSWKTQKQPGNYLGRGQTHQYPIPGTNKQLQTKRGIVN